MFIELLRIPTCPIHRSPFGIFQSPYRVHFMKKIICVIVFFLTLIPARETDQQAMLIELAPGLIEASSEPQAHLRHRVFYKHKITEYKKTFYIT